MKIERYKYNPETFEKQAYELMLVRDEKDKRLKQEEKKVSKNINMLNLNYYHAYLDYMHSDSEHMASFLAYIKHEYEMMIRTKPLFFNNDEMITALDEHIVKAGKMFELYYDMYENLKNAEYELKEGIQSFEEQKFKQDLPNLMTLHALLERMDSFYLITYTLAEEYRTNFGFPFVEECLKLRNTGIKFETYQERAKKIVESQETEINK